MRSAQNWYGQVCRELDTMIKIILTNKSSKGPSIDELLGTVEKHAPVRRAARLTSNPGLSAEQATIDQKAWCTNTTQRLRQRLQRNAITSDDEQLYRGMMASGVLNLEPELAEEMAQMMSQGYVRIASLGKCY